MDFVDVARFFVLGGGFIFLVDIVHVVTQRPEKILIGVEFILIGVVKSSVMEIFLEMLI
jgi:hypothetical protein